MTTTMSNSHNQSNFFEKMQRCENYLKGLEEERCKIQVFQRELPLCLELVTQAIEKCKQQLSERQYECPEQTSSDIPVLEEFIPIKRTSTNNSDGDEQKSKKRKNDDDDDDANVSSNSNGKIGGNIDRSKKSDWLKYVQLWNQTPDPPSKQDSPRKVGVVEVKGNGSGGAFHPFKKEIGVDGFLPPASTSSTAGNGGENKKEEKCQRKSRRCWSPELHKRFLQALQQLGGAHVATPKQIRELMKVDGLTNDEVKSHLQKYRLHTRRPSSVQNTTINTQTPQFVVVGGIWVPPEYAATTTSGEAFTNKVYAPIATLPPSFQKQQMPSLNSGVSHGEGRVISHSPATSSSTHTTTASPAY